MPNSITNYPVAAIFLPWSLNEKSFSKSSEKKYKGIKHQTSGENKSQPNSCIKFSPAFKSLALALAMSDSSSSAVSTTEKSQQFGTKQWFEPDLIGRKINERIKKSKIVSVGKTKL